ncbi:YdcF family protein [Streptomyces sp. SID6673]|nr:YdcF family protein [Streptomyces sp. SID11726]NEB27417.1 YdcF family protein [Streptomyces sp. SID6673]
MAPAEVPSSAESPPRQRSRFRSWILIRRAIVSICVLLVAVLVAGLPVYVFPQTDYIRRADAIIVLGGVGYDRYPYAFKLGAEAWAPVVVVSNANGTRDPWLTRYCGEPHAEFHLHCFVPEPRTTSGEAHELGRLAREFNWHTVIAVTSRPHISRARYILRRCFDGELIMVSSPGHISPLRWVAEYGYQTAGYARAALREDC